MSWTSVNERWDPIFTADRGDAAFVAALRSAHPERERHGFARRPYSAKLDGAEICFGPIAPKPAPKPAAEPVGIAAPPAAMPKPRAVPLALDRAAQIAILLGAVAAARGITVEQMTGEGKPRTVVLARRIAAQFLITELGLSQSHAGRLLNRDHTTIFFGSRALRRRLAADPVLVGEVAALRATIRTALGRVA